MEDKTFELLTKMYSEFTDFRKESNNRFDKIENDISDVKSDILGVKNDVIRLENKLEPKVDALLDGYKQNYEMLHETNKKLDQLSEKVGTQEVEIKVLKGGKK